MFPYHSHPFDYPSRPESSHFSHRFFSVSHTNAAVSGHKTNMETEAVCLRILSHSNYPFSSDTAIGPSPLTPKCRCFRITTMMPTHTERRGSVSQRNTRGPSHSEMHVFLYHNHDVDYSHRELPRQFSLRVYPKISYDARINNPMPLRTACRRVLWIFTCGLFRKSRCIPLCG